MKELINFIKWQWSKWELWQKGYIFGAFFLGAGAVAPEPYRLYLFAIPVFMFFFWTGKWCIWDQVRASWDNYQAEKQKLFSTIKESDK